MRRSGREPRPSALRAGEEWEVPLMEPFIVEKLFSKRKKNICKPSTFPYFKGGRIEEQQPKIRSEESSRKVEEGRRHATKSSQVGNITRWGDACLLGYSLNNLLDLPRHLS